VAEELSKLTGYTVFDNHRVVDLVVDLFPRSNSSYESVRTSASRTIRILLMEGAAECGINLINTFAPLADDGTTYMQTVEAAVRKHGGEVCYVQLLPSDKALKERVQGASRKGRKIDTIELWEQVKAKSPFMVEKTVKSNHLVIDNSDMSAAEAARTIAAHYHLTIA
jgi:hypothetical protein